jgi:DNA-binding GntR family transcriptional regulator
MRGYQTLLEAAAQASAALQLDDIDACVIQDASVEMEHSRTRRSFEKFALRFDRAFHGLILSGNAVGG